MSDLLVCQWIIHVSMNPALDGPKGFLLTRQELDVDTYLLWEICRTLVCRDRF